MFYRITNSVKKLVIQELQALFVDHPIFGNGNLVITNKFQFAERPKFAIIVKAATSDSVKLSLDNFKGIVTSYTTLANLKNKPGRMIEWVREDVANIENVVKPGFYVVNMVCDERFTVQPYLTVADEIIEPVTDTLVHATLAYKNINPGSDYLITETAQKLIRDKHYTIDYVNGIITFLMSIDDYGEIRADYQYIGTKSEEFHVEPETINNKAIPGVILAFGNFLKQGGLQVVVVYGSRQEVAKAYLGKWQMSLNLTITAQDTDTQEQLADLTAMYVWAVLQDKLVNDGITIEDISIAGESEEEENATANELSFTADLSFKVAVEWEVYQPILGVIKQIFLNRIEDFGQYEEIELNVRSGRKYDKTQVGVDYSLGLQPVEDLMPVLIRPVPRYTSTTSVTTL